MIGAEQPKALSPKNSQIGALRTHDGLLPAGVLSAPDGRRAF